MCVIKQLKEAVELSSIQLVKLKVEVETKQN